MNPIIRVKKEIQYSMAIFLGVYGLIAGVLVVYGCYKYGEKI
jgi:hypothetical protein